MKTVLRDPAPDTIAAQARKAAQRLALAEERMIARLMRLLGGAPSRCSICGSTTDETRRERCRGACEG
jgi:hypothetical protein